MGRDSSVGIATYYEVEGPGIVSRWVWGDFLHPSRPVLGPTVTVVQWIPGLFPGEGVKGPDRGVDHLSASSAEVKERVKLYLYSPLGFCGLFWGDLYLYVFNIKQL